MNVTLQKDNLFGKDGPQSKTVLHVMEIRKDAEGDVWLRAVNMRGQDDYVVYWVNLDAVLVPNLEGNETTWSTHP